jgi:hypothetical protein
MTRDATDAGPRAARAFALIGGRAAATAVILGAVGYWPTVAIVPEGGVAAMLVGLAVALVGAWAGTVPSVLYLRKPPQEHPIGILLGLLVRFLVTAGLALALWLTGAWAEKPLLLWIGMAQFVLLGVDVTGLVSLLKSAAKETTR